MSKAFDKISEGLKEAIAFAEGYKADAKIYTRSISSVDVAAVRKATGLSRPKFSQTFALDARAIQDWEQGRRVPDRAAQAYLKVIKHNPEAVKNALSASREGAEIVSGQPKTGVSGKRKRA